MTAIVKSAMQAANRGSFAGSWPGRIVAVTLTLCALQACSKMSAAQHGEMDWARAALERNDQLQVVASDPQARTFTVRLKDSDELKVLSLDQLVAGPTVAANNTPKQSEPTSAAADQATSPAAAGANAATAPQPAQPPAQGQTASNDQSAQPASGSENGASAAEPSGATPAPTAGPHAEPASQAKAGSVLASGPGYTIKASGSQPAPGRAVTGQTSSRGLPLERLHDPIICQGSRLLHIDNRNLQFDGDAVTAEDGCELHITNSHIQAKGIGVLARAASVHIENSEIDGDGGSIDASDGAQVYAEASRFKGLTRHMEASAFHDLGGNVWN
ncbi:MAG TPA: hypothetical protein VFB37_16715 [Steroidobacteraceae bacterium]|nr:hypothetical protein [Steroidobacteraceae bacterium]